MTTTSGNRIWFLQVCRALACMTIVYVHWITYVYTPGNLKNVLHLNLLDNYPHIAGIENYFAFLNKYLPIGFSQGFFALGLFFLISGYVTPLTINKGSPVEFLIRRFFRVYPTLLVCIPLLLCMVSLARMIEHLPPAVYSWQPIVANMLLVRNFFHLPYIEPVLWTLEIDIHLYFIFFLLAVTKAQKSAIVLLIIPIVLAFISQKNAVYIDYALVGSCLFHWCKGNWSGKKTVVMIVALMLLDLYFLTHLKHMQLNGARIFTNHLSTLSFFLILLLLNKHLIYSRILDKIADISYPLYIIHSITGYVTYHLLFLWTHNYLFAVIVTFTLIISLSLLIHHYIELPFMELSKRITSYRKEPSVFITPIPDKS